MIIFAWHIEFARPLGFAVLAALPLWIIFWRRSLVQLSSPRRVLSIFVRTLLLIAIAVGLSGPTATGQLNLKIVEAKRNPPRPLTPPPSVVLTAPGCVRAGEPFALEVLARSATSTAAKMELARDSQPLLQETITLVAGENHKTIPVMVERPSRVAYEVKMSGLGIIVNETRGSRGLTPPVALIAACPVYVDLPPRVLLVESQAGLAAHLKKALTAAIIDVEVRVELPEKVETLNQFDLIILANVSAEALPQSRVAALQDYVRGGGGLIAIGGDRAFTVGNYRRTPLEDMLPVISEERKSKPKPTLAMVLALDISGSMNDLVAKGAKERNIDLAKQALRRAVDMLGPRDQVGVLVFEDTSRWIWPLSAVTDKERIKAKIDTIQAEGGTNMYPPLEQAYLALRESFADAKHIIVSTDGIGAPGDFEALAQKMAAAGITMSTVGVGSEPVRPFLQKLADEAKGRAYFCDNGQAISRIFQTDTGVAAKIGITEEPFFPQVVQATDVLRGLDMSRGPTLLGYVETQARPDARVLLAAKTGEPILAMWRYGGGTTAAFTSDVQNRWAAPWLNWPDFGRFWVQVARAVMRPQQPQPSRLTAEAADGRLYITLDAEDRDGHFINDAEVRVTVEQDGRKTAELPLTQIAPGRYTASQAAGPGIYWLNAEIRRGGKLLETVRGAAAVVSMPETVLPNDGSIETFEQPGLRTILLWPWLLGIAAVVLVLDLTVRRTGKPVPGK